MSRARSGLRQRLTDERKRVTDEYRLRPFEILTLRRPERSRVVDRHVNGTGARALRAINVTEVILVDTGRHAFAHPRLGSLMPLDALPRLPIRIEYVQGILGLDVDDHRKSTALSSAR